MSINIIILIILSMFIIALVVAIATHKMALRVPVKKGLNKFIPRMMTSLNQIRVESNNCIKDNNQFLKTTYNESIKNGAKTLGHENFRLLK